MREQWHFDRLLRLQASLRERGLDGILLLEPETVAYLTGFFHYPSERPIMVFVPAQGDLTLAVPRLEADHAQGSARDVLEYEEFPGSPPAWDAVLGALLRRGLDGRRVGYEGSLGVAAFGRLRAAVKGELVDAGDLVTALRMVKGPEEIALVRQAAAYSDRMVSAGVRYVLERGPEVSEAEVAEHVAQVLIDLFDRDGAALVFVRSAGGGLVCFGDHSAWPHALPTLRRLGADHTLLLSLGCQVGGYAAECERTFFLRRPSADERRAHEAVQAAQRAARDAMRPGTPCDEPDRVARQVLEEAGYGAFLRHRVGHGMGLRFHEPPWLARGDETPLPVGAVVSCEPGIYVPGHFGVRIADTVLIGADGPESLTGHPQDWRVSAD